MYGEDNVGTVGRLDAQGAVVAVRARRAREGDYGLAQAGGYAVRAHGMGDRPSGDVDLITDWRRRIPVTMKRHGAGLPQPRLVVPSS